MAAYNGRADLAYTPPSHVGSAIITTAGAVVAQNWPTGFTGSTGAKVVQFSSEQAIVLNAYSTGAAYPTTNSVGTTGSTASNLTANVLIAASGFDQPFIFRIPISSTGYSITARTSGVVSIGFWEL